LEWWLKVLNENGGHDCLHLQWKFLSIPAMSDELERVFLGGRRTIPWERAKIGPLSLERTECMKSWFRSGIWEMKILKMLVVLTKHDTIGYFDTIQYNTDMYRFRIVGIFCQP